jgi:GNAT superfamily N-acetyltransferase
MMIKELPFGDVPAAQSVVNAMLSAGADKHPALVELRRDVWRGGQAWVLLKAGAPVSLHCSKVGKRRKNIWEPVLNWYSAYTLPTERRKGYASLLYAEVESHAVQAGCRRIKSLAGSSAGLALHRHFGHQCWGLTESREVWVNSVLPGVDVDYTGLTPPQAPGTLMSSAHIELCIRTGLRYDHGK